MKKICIFLQLLCFLNLNYKQLNFANAKVENTVYAKVNDDCILFKSKDMNDALDDVYFVIPESYFVVILETVNDNCFKVQYDKYFGYINSSKVTIAKFTPIVKSLDNIKCDLKETAGTQIWSKPSTSGNVLTTIPAGTLNLNYIAYAFGEIPIGGESNVWFYITYTPKSNSTDVYEGYIYAENVSRLDEIVYNAETNPEIIEEIQVVSDKEINLSSTFKTVLVSIISIPIILLISIILYKFVKLIQKNTKKDKFENNSNDVNFENLSNDNNYFRDDLKLKYQMNKLKNQSFIKVNTLSKKQNYPKFPSYDEDDDLL